MRHSPTLPTVLVALFSSAIVTAAPEDRAGFEFFEKKVRPVLVEHCYACHSTEAKKRRGGLLLDTRDGIRKGGDTGPAVVPGKPSDSFLLTTVQYADPQIKMPPKGKLPPAVIADLEQWIKMGAPDPRVKGATTVTKGIDIEKGRKFWAFQPPTRRPVPTFKDTTWPRSDVDRFVLA